MKLTANILFSGIGCQERGFNDSGVFEIDVLHTSEISKEAVLSYAAVHCGMTDEMVAGYGGYPSREEMAQYLTDINLGYEPEKDKKYDWFKLTKKKGNDLEKYWLACKLTRNLGDISKINELQYADLWTISFCCQDISVAGKMKGFAPDSGTRSSLLWENIRLLKTAKENGTLPKYLMFENVKNLVSKRFIDDFNNLLSILDDLGYNSYWQVLNGKDCGVPQSRERVFVISIRKDIDTGKFNFPKPFDNGLRLRDILEPSVDEEYYLSEDKVEKFLENLEEKDFLPNELNQIGHINENNADANRVYTDELARTLKSEAGGGGAKTGWYMIGMDKSYYPSKPKEYANCITAREDRGFSNRMSEGTAVIQIPVLLSEKGTKLEAILDHSNTLLARDYKGFGNQGMTGVIEAGQFRPKDRDYNKHGTKPEKQFETRKDGISNAILTSPNNNCIRENFRIRKLTPRECWKLMGLSFDDCDKAKSVGIAKTHLYKQAGNGIITDCCKLLAEHLYKAQYDEGYECADENFTGPLVG